MTNTLGTLPDQRAMADRHAIEDVLHSHCRGLDRQDTALLLACYWPDAEVDYGAYRGPAHSFAELVLPALAQTYELTRHCISNILIELRGERALAESYVTAGHLLLGAKAEMLFGGRYLDTLEQREGRWKLVHRQVVMDWSRQHAVTDERESNAFTAMAKGGHGEGDPLPAFLQLTSKE